MQSLGQSASALGRQFANLTPFANAARTALINLGAAAQQSQPALVDTLPLAQRLNRLGSAGQPTSANLKKLLASLNSSGAIQQLMTLLFNGAVAGNGFDSLGHYVRDEPLVSSCTNYATSSVPGCSANFAGASAASVSAAVRHDPVVTRAVASASGGTSAAGATMKGLLSYLTGGGR
jgi:hypothetical protein